VRGNSRAKAFRCLGSRVYLSLMKEADAVVGNSSSGLLEAPALRVPAINIGSRQQGRVRAASVIDCEPNSASIQKSLRKAFSRKFRFQCQKMIHPYGQGGAAAKIMHLLKARRHQSMLRKKFFDQK